MTEVVRVQTAAYDGSHAANQSIEAISALRVDSAICSNLCSVKGEVHFRLNWQTIHEKSLEVREHILPCKRL